jgi:hypothetical protein
VAKEDLGDARLLHAKTFLDLVQILSKGELQNRVTIFFSMYSSTDLGLPRHRIARSSSICWWTVGRCASVAAPRPFALGKFLWEIAYRFAT